jgi:hypothetical protein
MADAMAATGLKKYIASSGVLGSECAMMCRIFVAVVALEACLVFAAAGASARPYSQSGAHAPSGTWHQFYNRNIRPFRRGIIFGSGYYGPVYDPGYDYAPGELEVAPPRAPQAAAEKRRECEPKTYTVPNATGGESQVTVVRC